MDGNDQPDPRFSYRASLFAILQNRKDEISPRMSAIIVALYEDWLARGWEGGKFVFEQAIGGVDPTRSATSGFGQFSPSTGIARYARCWE